MVFLEASGLSDPIAIAQMLDFKELKKRLYLAKIWTVVDSSKFLQQTSLVTRLQHQVRIADTVIVNKTDLSNSEQLQKVEEEIKKLNPFAEILQGQYCQIEDLSLEAIPIEYTVAFRNKENYMQFESCDRPDIGVGILKSTRSISKEKLKQFIEYHSKNTIRMKGFAKLSDDQFVAIQSSYDRFELKEIENYNGPTEIIAMGEDFNLSSFSKKYRELAE